MGWKSLERERERERESEREGKCKMCRTFSERVGRCCGRLTLYAIRCTHPCTSRSVGQAKKTLYSSDIRPIKTSAPQSFASRTARSTRVPHQECLSVGRARRALSPTAGRVHHPETGRSKYAAPSFSSLLHRLPREHHAASVH